MSACWTSVRPLWILTSATWRSIPSRCAPALRLLRQVGLANLLLAVLLYSIVNWGGVQEPKAVLSSPVVGSVADKAGLVGGELVRRAATGDDELVPMRSFEELRWVLTQGALDGERVRLELQNTPNSSPREVVMDLSVLDVRDANAQLFRKIGVMAPWTRPSIGEVMPGGAAERAGLRSGDVVRRVGNTNVVDGMQLRELIRSSVQEGKVTPQIWMVERGGQVLELEVVPDNVTDGSVSVGRINAYVGDSPNRRGGLRTVGGPGPGL